MLEPAEELATSLDIDTRANYIASGQPNTTGHGEDVLEMLGYFAPEATFDLYRVVAGVLATLRSDLAEHASEPSPAELRHAVALGATDIDEGAVPKFDARQTRDRLRTDR